MSIINYKKFNIENLSIITNYIKYNNDNLYIQTPSLIIADFFDVNNNTYLKLKINNNTQNGINFINTLLSIEKKIQKSITNNKFYFSSQIIKDINENIYIKVNIKNLTVFNKQKNILSFTSLNTNITIVGILNYSDIYFDNTSNKYGYYLDINQIMII